MFLRYFFILAFVGAALTGRSQNFNEYSVYFGKERKEGKKIVFDTIIAKIKMTAPVSASHIVALEIANSKAKDYGMVARVKYIRRLKSTEQKKSEIKFSNQ
jgi:hypothetical protein